MFNFFLKCLHVQVDHVPKCYDPNFNGSWSIEMKFGSNKIGGQCWKMCYLTGNFHWIHISGKTGEATAFVVD